VTAPRKVLLRPGPAVPNELKHSAGDELASVNAQVAVILRRALTEAGRVKTPRAAPAGVRPRSTPDDRRPGPVELGAAGA
jgi:hypothetical protein